MASGTESPAALVSCEVGSEILHWQSWALNSTYQSLRAEEGTEKGRAVQEDQVIVNEDSETLACYHTNALKLQKVSWKA